MDELGEFGGLKHASTSKQRSGGPMLNFSQQASSVAANAAANSFVHSGANTTKVAKETNPSYTVRKGYL